MRKPIFHLPNSLSPLLAADNGACADSLVLASFFSLLLLLAAFACFDHPQFEVVEVASLAVDCSTHDANSGDCGVVEVYIEALVRDEDKSDGNDQNRASWTAKSGPGAQIVPLGKALLCYCFCLDGTSMPVGDKPS